MDKKTSGQDKYTFTEAIWWVSNNATQQPCTILYMQQDFSKFNDRQQRGQLYTPHSTHSQTLYKSAIMQNNSHRMHLIKITIRHVKR